MNSNFDLNINNYTIIELEEIFELPPNHDETIIEIKETKLRQHIINDKSIVSSTKTNTLDFIDKVKKKLLENLKINSNANLNVNLNTDSNLTSVLNKNIHNLKHLYNLDKTLNKSNIIDAGGTYIIEKPITPYTQSSPSEFYPGIINPLNKRILKKNINIDTRFRDNYYTTLASNFHVNLPLKLSKIVSLQLSALELPNTFYVISQIYGNNFFVLEIVDEEPLIVTIPDGNYDNIGLQNYINHFLSIQPGSYPNIQFLIDVNTPNGTGNSCGSAKMIVGSTNGITDFSINFVTDRYGNEDKQTPLPLKFGWLIGFRDGYYENNTTYVSEGVINLLGPRYIYLAVDDFNNSVLDGFYGAFTSSIINKNILARISLQGNLFNFLSKDNFNLITTPRQYFGPVDIQKLQIQLLDEYGRILNLNNMDYSFCLTFQTIYEL
jgi:hypothetical protein